MSTPARTVAFQTVGCKLNYAETDTLQRSFAAQGFHPVSFHQVADVYVINTCSVTAQADRDCRKLVRQARRRNPSAFIAVTGCYAQLQPDTLQAMEEVNAVFGSREKFSLLDSLLEEESLQRSVLTSPVESLTTFQPSYSLEHRTRAYLKVQDGCDYPCTYCTIPQARGRSRNGSIAELVEQARTMAAAGARELVLTGVNVGDFGRTTGERFADLLRALQVETSLDRIRISSLEPNLLSDEILDLMAEPNTSLAPHLHLPLQSGSNRILRTMKRRYRREQVAERVRSLHLRLPEAAVGIDVIVGFPGEGDAEFQETEDFLTDLDCTYLHVFSFSPRPGTPAADYPRQVDRREIARRSARLRQLSTLKRRRFQERWLNREAPVLFEYTREGYWWGHTPEYILVRVPAEEENLHNRIRPVLLSRNGGAYMEGQLS
ncbi:MAG: tRNA (N(6)-L-threonylcarbamoyladenosine(37)-C(2))-methylthiotransferase MtaB [Candidatus Neomarinimicrobiota bacterium]|nr:MAG: tRNA (N(6)-L-threonylcarbamoyladenosine(37)-C(2))-methylthiotransferase MtaB [Candidatus Neomarinimicrobiota bacterium]